MTIGKLASALSIAAILTALGSVPSFADDPAKLDGFTTACATSDELLLGEETQGVDTQPIMQPLCACLVTQFSGFTQPEIDMLTSDLAGTATPESHTAYGDYETLSGKAADGVETCFASDDVRAAMDAMAAKGQ